MNRASSFVLALALAAAPLVAGCKKGPKPTIPFYPDASQMAAGENVDLPEATLFHIMLRSMASPGAVLTFYKPELDRRGARPLGGSFGDENVVHTGDFGRSGMASVKDPTQPGIWLAISETNSGTLVDIWEAVPKH